MKPAGPTEARVRGALLRLWERHGHGVEVLASCDDVKREANRGGGPGGYITDTKAIQRVGRAVASGKGFGCSPRGWSELDDDLAYTYSRGVFTVRRRPAETKPGPALTKAFADLRALDEPGTQTRSPCSCNRCQEGLPLAEPRPRRPFDDDEPDGYMESDRDYLDNNNSLAVHLLDAYIHGHPAEPRVTQRHLDLPELPPGYRVGPCEGEWLIGNEDCWFDDDDWGEPQETREEAVELAWEHFEHYGDQEWVEFIAAVRERGRRG